MKHRKIIVGPSVFTEESVISLINDCDDFTEIDLFLDGLGGCIYHAQVLLKYLNSRKDDINIFIMGQVCSAHAIISLIKCHNKVFIYPDFEFAMFHKIDSQEYSRRKVDTKYNKYNSIDMSNNLLVEDLKNWLTKKQIKKFNKGKDVELSRKELQKRFHNKDNIYFL